MEIRTFWNILFKILGLWLVLNGLYLIPSYISSSAIIFNSGAGDAVLIALIFVIIAFVYLFIIRLFIFNTNKVIDKLKLADSIDEKRIDLNISYTKLLTIAIIIIGAIILIESLPLLVLEMIQFFQQKLVMREYPDTGWMIFYVVKSVIGYLLITNNKRIVSYINSKSKIGT